MPGGGAPAARRRGRAAAVPARGGRGRAWHEFHALLPARGFEVFAPDHPGFGKSDDFADVEAIDDLVYHYLDVIDALGLARPHVVGGSFGGWIAAELAVAAPHRIGSLVLLTPAGLRLPEHPVADLFLHAAGEAARDAVPRPGAARAAPPPARRRPRRVHRRVPRRDLAGPVLLGAVLCNPKLERRLARITAPTLVVGAVRRPAHPRRARPALRGADPRHRVAEVADCGHAMYFERPAEFASPRAFLANTAWHARRGGVSR